MQRIAPYIPFNHIAKWKKVSKHTLSLDSSIHLVAYGWDGGKSVGGGGGALRIRTRRWLIHRWRWRADW